MREVAAALAAGWMTLTPGLATAETFTSGGRQIEVERFPAAGGGARRPAVIVLHGADGLAFGGRYRQAATLLASAGYEALLVHYLDRTGDRRASYFTIGRNLGAWTETARDAVTWASRQPGIDPNRIGLLGVSLGGAIAMQAAAGDPRVKALVDYFGFVPQSFPEGARLPPTLVLHGAEDRIVPASNATRLDAILKANGVPHETVIYPGQGHGFTGQAQADAAGRVVAFFGRTLRGRATARR